MVYQKQTHGGTLHSTSRCFFLSILIHKNDNIILKCPFFKLCFLFSLSLNFSSGDICLLSKLIHRRGPKISRCYLHRYNLTIFLQSLEQTFSQVTGVCASLSLEFFRWSGKFLGLNLFWAVKVFDSQSLHGAVQSLSHCPLKETFKNDRVS